MALPPRVKKKETGNNNQDIGAKKANPASTQQVHNAIAAFVKNKKKMGKKTQQRVAARLKGMKNG